jgi:ERCC4-related helicase
MVATSLLEEGIDVTAVNLVIRFDYVQTPTAHIQSKGRARARVSSCVHLV